MKELLWSAIAPLCFVGGFVTCIAILHKMKNKLLDVPKENVTVQDITEWVKRKRETDALLALAKEMRNKFLAGG